MKNINLARRLAPWAGGLLLVFAVTACNDLLEVDNPNNLIEEDLQNPSAAQAIVDGAEYTVGQGISYIMLQVATASDELIWTGSRDAWNQIDRGYLLDRVNEFSNAAFPFVGEGRWTADNAITLLQGFGDALSDDQLLAEAYLYGALMYSEIASNYNDFVISAKGEAGTPVGPGNMSSLYDTALGYINSGLATATGDLKNQLMAAKAKVEFAKARRGAALNGSGLVNAAAAAREALAAIGETDDIQYQFSFSASTVANEAAEWVNDRQEQACAPVFNELVDPVTGELDTRAQATISQWNAGDNDSFTPLVWMSTRELLLIVAESELAQGNSAGAVEWINKARALTDSPAYDGSGSVQDMLIHERAANLYMQTNRLHDLYRFNIESPYWDASSDTRSTGTYFPIADVEVQSNPNVPG